MKTQNKKGSITMLKLFVAIMFFIILLSLTDPWVTGVSFHEWICIILVLPILLVHIQLDWKWIIRVSKKIFKKSPDQTLFNYIWDWFLFINTSAVFISGFLISESILPLMGITSKKNDPFWSATHNNTSVWLMLMLGVHIAMHWKWIKNSFQGFSIKKLVLGIKTFLTPSIKSIYQYLIIAIVGLFISYFVYLLDFTEAALNSRNMIIENVEEQKPIFVSRLTLSFIFSFAKVVFGALVTFGILGIRKLKRNKLNYNRV